MEFNSFLFPAPQSSYTIHGSIGDIIYIPRKFKNQKQSNQSENNKENNQDNNEEVKIQIDKENQNHN